MKRAEDLFRDELIKEIETRFAGSIVLKNDPDYIQGIPDLIVLYGPYWAALECKRSAKASHRPNQDYYIRAMDEMSFGAFIFPENKEEILDALQRTFRIGR